MAIYHLHMQTISLSEGRSAVAAAAYRSASRLCDPHGTVFDFRRKAGVVHSNIIVPNGYPAIDRQVLWCMAEAAEKRKNSTVAREMDVALPIECSREEQLEIVSQFCSWIAEKWQVAVDFNLHYPTNTDNPDNPHTQPPAHPAPSQGHTADPVPDRQNIERLVCGYLKDRNLERAKAGFERVRESKTAEKH